MPNLVKMHVHTSTMPCLYHAILVPCHAILGENISTNDCVCALIWRLATRARKIPSDQKSKFGQACNGRLRMDPPLPENYFGNVNLYCVSEMLVEELLDSPIGKVAKQIRKSVNAMTADRIKGMHLEIKEFPAGFGSIASVL